MVKRIFVSGRDEVFLLRFFLILFFCLSPCCRNKQEPASDHSPSDRAFSADTTLPRTEFRESQGSFADPVSDAALSSLALIDTDTDRLRNATLIEKMWLARQKGLSRDSVAANRAEQRVVPIIQVSGEVNFGSVEVNGQKVQVLNVANAGKCDLLISWIDLPYGFSTKAGSALVVPCEQRKAISIQFTPLVPRQYKGAIYIRSNANNGTLRVDCCGTGIASSATTREDLTELSGSLTSESRAHQATAMAPKSSLDSAEVDGNHPSFSPVVPSNLSSSAPLLEVGKRYAVSVQFADYSAAPPIAQHSLHGGWVRGFWLAVQIPRTQLRTRIRLFGVDAQFDPVIGVKQVPDGPYLRPLGEYTSYSDNLGRGGDETCVIGGTGRFYIRIYHCDDSELLRGTCYILVEPGESRQ